MGEIKTTQQYHATGAILSKKDVRDYKAICAANAEEFPEEFQLEICPIKNQGAVNSCVAHALAAVIEYYNKAQTGEFVEMSTAYIYGNRTDHNYIGKGMSIRDALKSVSRYGTPPAELCKGNYEVPKAQEVFNECAIRLYPDAYKNHITGYYLAHGEDEKKAALLKGCPIVISVNMAKFELSYKKTVINGAQVYHSYLQTKDVEGNSYHCMYIYGWNKDGWLVANSWSTVWGTDGKTILPYNAPIEESWAVEDVYCEQTQAELQSKFDVLQGRFNNLLDDFTALNKAKKELETAEAANEKEIEALKAEIDSKSQELYEVNGKLNNTLEQLSAANKELIEIKKPYQSGIGQIIAHIINFILRLFEKK